MSLPLRSAPANARAFRAVAFACGLVSTLCSLRAAAAPGRVLRFDAPATHFTESCPLGNGRLGAMVFGGVAEERIVLNETGMWSGSPQDADRPDAYKSLPEIRRLLLEGKNAEAEALVNAHFTCAGAGSARGRGANAPYGSYQVLGDLRLKFDGVAPGAQPGNYERVLDLGEAVARVGYELDGVRLTRELFVSAPDQVVVMRLSASKAGALGFELSLDRPERGATSIVGDDGLLMAGQLADGKNGPAGVRYAARVNGLTGLAVTKMDVLDTLPEIRIAVGYEVGGEVLDDFPADLELLAEANPVFETLPGWQASTAEARRWEDLPEGARNYLQRIEELTGVPVWYVSVGTRRDQIIHIERNG